jgi:hypothetical protein
MHTNLPPPSPLPPSLQLLFISFFYFLFFTPRIAICYLCPFSVFLLVLALGSCSFSWFLVLGSWFCSWLLAVGCWLLAFCFWLLVLLLSFGLLAFAALALGSWSCSWFLLLVLLLLFLLVFAHGCCASRHLVEISRTTMIGQNQCAGNEKIPFFAFL